MSSECTRVRALFVVSGVFVLRASNGGASSRGRWASRRQLEDPTAVHSWLLPWPLVCLLRGHLAPAPAPTSHEHRDTEHRARHETRDTRHETRITHVVSQWRHTPAQTPTRAPIATVLLNAAIKYILAKTKCAHSRRKIEKISILGQFGRPKLFRGRVRTRSGRLLDAQMSLQGRSWDAPGEPRAARSRPKVLPGRPEDAPRARQ